MDLDRLNRELAGRYRLERALGSGGMATVWLAEDLRHHRRVAVKVLRPELAEAVGPERFLREIEILARLNHPHILPLHDSGRVGDTLYYVMPAVDGTSLRDRLDREGRLAIDDALRIAGDVAAALDYAHRQGVVHRDVKPENVLLHEGEALVTDFGIALAVAHGRGERLTGTGLVAGTPQYMSPEQASGGAEPDARSDIWALGCVVYEMLTGEPPHSGPTPQSVVAKILADPVPSVRRLRETVPEAVDAAVRRALAKDPVDRFDTAADLAASLASLTAEPPRPRFTRRARVTGALAVAAVVGVGSFWILRPALEPPAVSAETLAVLPWTVPDGAVDLAYLSEGLVHLLTASLDGVGDTRVVDPHALLSFVDRECGAVDPACGQRVATRFGAERYLLGTVVPLGSDRFELIARPYSRDGTALESVRATAATESPEIAIDVLGRGLLATEAQGTDAVLEGVAVLTSRSLPALKAYLEGERAFRGLDIPLALDAFGRALAVDSTFALAHYRLAEAAEWAGQFDLSREHASEALRYRDRLPERARRLLEAFELWLSGDATAAEAEYRSILRTYPDDVTAWYWLAEIVLHWNALRARPPAEAEELFGRVLTYDPNHTGALVHFIETKERRGDLSDVDSLTDRFMAQSQLPAFDFFVDAPRVLATRDPARLRDMMALADTLDDDALLAGAVNGPSFSRNLRDGRALVAELTDARREPFVRALGHVILAHFDVAEGRWSAARSHLAEADALRPGWGLEHRAYLATLPWLIVDDAELRELQAELSAWDAEVPSWRPGTQLFLPIFLEPHVGSHEPIKLYLQGLVSARLGDVEAVRSYADRLDRAELPQRAGSFAPDAALTLRALAWDLEGNTARGVSDLEAAEMRVTYPLMFASPFHSRSRHRYLRAELLTRLGAEDAALGWYQTVADEAVHDLVYLAPAALRQGEIHERLENRDLALEHYRRFVELWRDADPGLRPLVEDVEERIERLSGHEEIGGNR